MSDWKTAAAAVPPLDAAAMAAARARQAQLTKPAGSLGRLEDLAVQLAGIQGRALPRLEHAVVVVMAADHGVACEGVSAYPQAVTGQMVHNFLAGGAAINVLARLAGARVVVVDLGVAGALPDHPALWRRALGPGTANLARGPAMSRAQAEAAIAVGCEVVAAEAARGLDAVVLGDMGIGNTTAGAAIVAALCGRPPAEVVGRGTGLDDAGWRRKVAVVERALAVNQPNPRDPLDVLARVGGFEHAGLVGVTLAAAARRVAVLVDGLAATAAALLAVRLCPAVREYLIAGHASAEPGQRAALAALDLLPLLDLGLRLGEGSGAMLALQLLRAAVQLHAEMATFAEAGVSERAAPPDAAG
ncbi:MAG TPA: nicotinate-nucleotide--dimethylbenzimidazole phosphoribosyltransferase [Chloroflexota bacterium]|nr:nicotinate-nucleotide--dimethylbenzimidazole phosphoribosyltransferase [Chloroflexota bacterium]